MAKVVVHNPQAQPTASMAEIGDLVPLRESRAGVLANQKQYADLVMNQIVDVLGARYGVIKTMTGGRPTSIGADPKQLDEFAKACDWVITGSAD